MKHEDDDLSEEDEEYQRRMHYLEQLEREFLPHFGCKLPGESIAFMQIVRHPDLTAQELTTLLQGRGASSRLFSEWDLTKTQRILESLLAKGMITEDQGHFRFIMAELAAAPLPTLASPRMRAPSNSSTEARPKLLRRQRVVVDASFLFFYSKEHLEWLCGLYKEVAIPPTIANEFSLEAGDDLAKNLGCFQWVQLESDGKELVERLYRLYRHLFPNIFQYKGFEANKGEIECLVEMTNPNSNYSAVVIYDVSFEDFVVKLRAILTNMRLKIWGKPFDVKLDLAVSRFNFTLLEIQRATKVKIKRNYEVIFDAIDSHDSLLELGYPSEAEDLLKTIHFLAQKIQKTGPDWVFKYYEEWWRELFEEGGI